MSYTFNEIYYHMHSMRFNAIYIQWDLKLYITKIYTLQEYIHYINKWDLKIYIIEILYITEIYTLHKSIQKSIHYKNRWDLKLYITSQEKGRGQMTRLEKRQEEAEIK